MVQPTESQEAVELLNEKRGDDEAYDARQGEAPPFDLVQASCACAYSVTWGEQSGRTQHSVRRGGSRSSCVRTQQAVSAAFASTAPAVGAWLLACAPNCAPMTAVAEPTRPGENVKNMYFSSVG